MQARLDTEMAKPEGAPVATDNIPENCKPRAVVVGGSIAGMSCALALARVGWEVTVVEKAASQPKGSATGAGLCLEPQAFDFVRELVTQNQVETLDSFILTRDVNRLTDSDAKMSSVIAEDQEFGFHAVHWYDIYSLLHQSVPGDGSVEVLWGHQFMSIVSSLDDVEVKIEVMVLESGQTVMISGGLLIAADGSQSSIRRHLLPDYKLRYSGYCAWRGVLDFQDNEDLEKHVEDIQNAYQSFTETSTFDLADKTHCVLYELRKKRLNWLWYVNQPEPELQGNSVTMKVTNEMIHWLHEEANKVWIPQLAKIMKETKEPFLNFIYDSDPLPHLIWGKIVLVGDAGHPTTPHGLRSTNMSILDAVVLSQCLKKWGPRNLDSALMEFQSIRHPVVTQQVMQSRRLGRLKQGLSADYGCTFNPSTATPDECRILLQKNMPYYKLSPTL